MAKKHYYVYICPKCNHSFISTSNKGSTCRYCGHKCRSDDVKFIYDDLDKARLKKTLLDMEYFRKKGKGFKSLGDFLE